MAVDTFNSFQIADALARQGLSQDYARTLSYQLGDKRLNREQTLNLYKAIGMDGAELPSGDDGKKDNSLLADTILGTALVGGAAGVDRMAKAAPGTWANKIGTSTLGKFAVPGAVATAAMMLNPFDTGNFAERASTPETLANLGGLVAGGAIGNTLGDSIGKDLGGKVGQKMKELAPKDPNTMAAKILKADADKVAKAAMDAAKTRGVGAALKEGLLQTGKAGAVKLASTAAGRSLGGTIGALGGPIGSVLLGTLGGYLAPKFMPGKSPTVEEDTGEARSDLTNLGLTAAGATALGLAVSPGIRARALSGAAAIKDSGIAKGVGEAGRDAAAAVQQAYRTRTPEAVQSVVGRGVTGVKGTAASVADFAKPATDYVKGKVAPIAEELSSRIKAGDAAYGSSVRTGMQEGGMPGETYKQMLKRLGLEGNAIAKGLEGVIRY